MPIFTPSASARSRIGFIDSANCFAAAPGGIPPRDLPEVIEIFAAPTALPNSSVLRISRLRSARCFGFGEISDGSKYGSGGASFQYPKEQLALIFETARFSFSN